MPVRVFARQIELNRVDPVFDQRANRSADLFGSGNNQAEIEAGMGDVRGRRVAQAADRGDLRPGRQITRPRKTPLVYEPLGDDVEPRFRRRSATPGSKARVEHQLRHLHGDEHVLLELHHLDGVDARRIVPREMQMRVDHAGHQSRAHAVDDRRSTVGRGRSAEARRPLCDLFDAVALDEHLAGVGIVAGCVEDADIYEVRAARSAAVPIVVRHVYLPMVCAAL